MKIHLGPFCLAITWTRRKPAGPAPCPEPVPVAHEEGVRRLREEVAAAIPVDDEELARAKVVRVGKFYKPRADEIWPKDEPSAALPWWRREA